MCGNRRQREREREGEKEREINKHRSKDIKQNEERYLKTMPSVPLTVGDLKLVSIP